jgi:hypothetical protein
MQDYCCCHRLGGVLLLSVMSCVPPWHAPSHSHCTDAGTPLSCSNKYGLYAFACFQAANCWACYSCAGSSGPNPDVFAEYAVFAERAGLSSFQAKWEAVLIDDWEIARRSRGEHRYSACAQPLAVAHLCMHHLLSGSTLLQARLTRSCLCKREIVNNHLPHGVHLLKSCCSWSRRRRCCCCCCCC